MAQSKADQLRLLRKKQELEALRAEQDPQEEKSDLLGAASAGAQQFGRSASFGTADYLGAGADVILDKVAPKSEEDKALEAQGFKIEQAGPVTFKEALARRQALEEQQKSEFPIATTVGEVAGFLPGGVGIGKGVAKVLPKLAGKAAEKGAVALGARAGLAGIEGAAQGAAFGAVPAMEGTGDIGEETLMGAGIGAAFPVAGAVARGAAKIPGKAIKVLLGPGEEVIQKYLARPDAIRAAKSMEEAVTMLDEATGKIKGEFESAALAKEEAEELYKGLSKELQLNQKITVSERKQLLQAAKDKLDASYMAEKELLKKANVPMSVIDDVQDANKIVKNKLIEESANARSILTKADSAKRPVKIAMSPVVEMLENEIKVLEKSVSDVDNASAADLKKYLERFKSKPELVGMDDSKSILQQLDRDIDFNYDSGAFNSSKDIVLKKIRGAINDTIGSKVPEYKAYMEKAVQPLAELRAQASKSFGKPDRARSKLLRIDTPGMEAEKDLLFRLGKAAGKDFESPLKNYQKSQALLKSPTDLESLRSSLPEAKDVARAEADLAQAQAVTRDQLEAQAKQTKEYAMLQEAKLAEQGKKELFDSISSFEGATTEAKIRSLMGSKENVKLRQKLAELSSLSGTDFAQMIDDMRVKAAFDKSFMNGSRNVNLWAMLGAFGDMLKSPQALGMGGAGTVMAGPIGGMVGVVFGGMVDRFGPRMAQGVLDGYLAIKGIPTVQKISKAMNGLNPKLKAEVLNDFRRMLVTGITQEAVEVPDAARPQMITEINASGLKPSQKAKMISELNRTGRLIDADRFMLGDEMPPQAPQPMEIKRQAPAVKDLSSQIQGRRNPSY